MGITGLIPFLEKSSSKVHLKDLKGCTVAVDTYCWLHKGVFSCADKLCRGEDTDMYVQFCLKYVSMLLSYDIKPILVFDGRHLPAKALTEKRRREGRDQSRKRAAELLRLGRIDEARSHMRRCIDVTHEMALRLIKECRLRNVDCVVAPYEADAQMAFLNKLDIAQYVITEDSDLVLFGCKKIIFKLDLAGCGLLVDAEKLYLSMGCRKEKYTFDKFRVMCILSGCDYLDSLPGIGLAKACKFILKTEEDNMRRALKKIPQYLNMRSLEVNDEYIENFLRADATFKHMFVYNPLERRMERLHELSTWNTDEQYCSNAGEILENDTALQLALGNLNPFSLKVLDTWNPDERFVERPVSMHHHYHSILPKSQVFSNVKRTKHKSIWLSNFQPHTHSSRKPITADIRCALQFKKVTYTCVMEPEEDHKSEEGDIISLYNAREPPRKRRCNSTENVTPRHEVTPTKKPYNPFPIVSPREKKPIFDLLLKPSPRKGPPVNPFKRSIFTTTTEVRSRFFASNVSLAGQTESTIAEAEPTPKIPAITDEAIVEEVTRIEVLSVKNKESAAFLYDYNSPSPERNCKSKPNIDESPISSLRATKSDAPTVPNQSGVRETKCEIPQSMDSGISSLRTAASEISSQLSLGPTKSEITPSIDSGINSLRQTASEPATQLSFNAFAFERNGMAEARADNVIELSDTEERVILTKKIPKKTPVQKQRTLGLSKLKKSTSANKLPVNQTRLSMFGFQKRPSLK